MFGFACVTPVNWKNMQGLSAIYRYETVFSKCSPSAACADAMKPMPPSTADIGRASCFSILFIVHRSLSYDPKTRKYPSSARLSDQPDEQLVTSVAFQ